MTRQEFGKGMLILQAAIGRKFDKPALAVWFRALGDLDADDFQYAVDRFICESKTAFPMPAVFRELADERRHGDVTDHAEAFGRLMKAVRVFGSYQVNEGMASLDATTQAAVRGCGGFLWFCEMEADQRHTAAAQFRLAYQGAQGRQIRDRRLPQTLVPAIAHQRYLEDRSGADGPVMLGEVIGGTT